MDQTGIRPWQRLTRILRLTRSSYVLISGFVATLLVIAVVWWPLVRQQLVLIDWEQPLWRQLDWLLLFDFAVMSLLIMTGADLKADVYTALIGLCGGLVIESWGTQTELWTYYTLERPPLWIIPAWPIASLSFARLARLSRYLVDWLAPVPHPLLFRVLYWLIFPIFYALMLLFVWPTMNQSLTLLALLLCTLLIVTPTDYRQSVLAFVAGVSLGYFLELWGTTRHCWNYYTRQTPPLFAVWAHGMAAVTFWRAGLLIRQVQARLLGKSPGPSCQE